MTLNVIFSNVLKEDKENLEKFVAIKNFTDDNTSRFRTAPKIILKKSYTNKFIKKALYSSVSK